VGDGQVRVLGAEHRVLCIDLRGTGRSDKPIGDYRMGRLVADVATVLEYLDLREATVVGWSFGGQVAFRLAATMPERLAQLVLVCSNGVRASRSEEFPFGPDADRLEPALVRGEAEQRIAMRRRTVRSGFHRDPDPDVVDWLLRCQLQMPSWAAIPCYGTYLRTDLVGDLASVRLPVLQLMGAEDPVTSAEGARWMQERLPDGRLVMFDDCGHYPMYEVRERFDEELLAFVAEG
jgi:non-heme chloroperoxidase